MLVAESEQAIFWSAFGVASRSNVIVMDAGEFVYIQPSLGSQDVSTQQFSQSETRFRLCLQPLQADDFSGLVLFNQRHSSSVLTSLLV